MQLQSEVIPELVHGDDLKSEGPSKKLALLGLISLSAVFLISVLFRPPATDYFTICGFKHVTGLPCPGCGLTHSFCALGKGAVGDSLSFNLLGPPLFLALILLWVRSGCVLFDKTKPVQLLDRLGRRFNLVRAFVFGFAVYGIIRIVYLISFHPEMFSDSPLSRLISQMMR